MSQKMHPEMLNQPLAIVKNYPALICSKFICLFVCLFVCLYVDDEQFELCTINPGYILGPVLKGSTCTSMEVHKGQMKVPLVNI